MFSSSKTFGAVNRARRSARAFTRSCAGVAAFVSLSGSASATWSIVIVNTRTGEVAAASATCLTGFDLQANTPVMLTGIGAATAQSAVDSDSSNRTFIRDRLNFGTAPQDILAGLLTFDSSPQSRQYGMVDVAGRAATFTGTQAGRWAGGRTGRVGDLVYAVQGNVLTGPPVVDFAVAAIENTPGDIPAKLMAAMEAARLYGGDGRCSCTTGTPDSCGSPPLTFTKSAHIAYMLIARAGDRDGANPLYKNLSATSAAIADFNGDGKPDIVTGGGNPSIAVLNNVTPPGRGASFAPGYRSLDGITNRDLAAVDVNGDGKPDVVGISNTADRVAVFIGVGDGTFAPWSLYFTGDGPIALAARDFNGDGKPDVVGISNTADRVAVFIGVGDGTFAPWSLYFTGDGPIALAARDFNGDGKLDIVTADANGKTLSLLANNGDGTLATVVSTSIGGGTPNFLATADFDGDGDLDIAVGTTAPNAVVIFTNTGGVFTRSAEILADAVLTSLAAVDANGDGKADLFFGFGTDTSIRYAKNNGAGFDVSLVPAGGAMGGIVVRDITGDGLPDLVTTLRTTSRLSIMPQLGAGGFGAPIFSSLNFNRNKLLLADLDEDGDLDAVMPTGSVLISQALSKGVFPNPGGLGGGDFFMTFNVPNQTTTDLDPVFTLRSRFDTWRTDLIGKPDAITSTATLDRAYVQADGVSNAVLTVRARDHTGAEIPLLASSLEVTNKGGSPLTSAGPVTQNLDGSLSVTITAGTACGADRYSLRLTGNFRPVTLMPETIAQVSPATDVNADGFVNGDDFDLYANLFVAGNLAADFNHDGFVTADDFDEFVAKFITGGC